MTNQIFRVVDVETTGLDPETDKVCEVAWVDITLNPFKLIRWFSTLIDPGIPIPPEVKAKNWGDVLTHVYPLFQKELTAAGL